MKSLTKIKKTFYQFHCKSKMIRCQEVGDCEPDCEADGVRHVQRARIVYDIAYTQEFV